MHFDTEKLISLVEARPALYDKTLKSYSDRQIKQKLWADISATLIGRWELLTPQEKTEIGKINLALFI